MAKDIRLKGTDYTGVPSILVPQTPYKVIDNQTANINKTAGTNTYYADAIVGLADYAHESVIATIDGVDYAFPYDPDPNNYSAGYKGYGANYTSSTTMDFSVYSYRVEDDDSAGKWRLYSASQGEHTLTVRACDKVPYHDVSMTTATANSVSQGKIFLAADGTITTGAASAGGIVPIAIRHDAELIKTYSYDKLVVDDEEKTIPAYTTTSTTLLASASLSPTITVDLTAYDYYVAIRTLSIPIYNVTSVAKGRVEYHANSFIYELVTIPANTYSALINSTKYNTRTNGFGASSFSRLIYWSSGTAITAYSTAAYGTYQTVSAPTISGSTVTIKSPALAVRGHTTYFTSTYFNALDDIRYQYIIDVYRAPKGNLNVDGWGTEQQTYNIIADAQSNTHKLT